MLLVHNRIGGDEDEHQQDNEAQGSPGRAAQFYFMSDGQNDQHGMSPPSTSSVGEAETPMSTRINKDTSQGETEEVDLFTTLPSN